MKLAKLILPLLPLLFALSVQGQNVMLNGYGAYVFDDKFDTYYSSTDYIEGKVKGGFMWGAGIEFKPREDFGVELLYFRIDTEAPVSFWNDGVRTRTIDLGINYIMAGGVRYFPVASDKVEPYGGLMLGAAVYSNKNPGINDIESITKFCWGARLGTNIWFSEKAGLKLQTYLLSAVQSAGGGLYFGTGGTGAGVSTYSTIYQFGLGGGLVFKIK